MMDTQELRAIRDQAMASVAGFQGYDLADYQTQLTELFNLLRLESEEGMRDLEVGTKRLDQVVEVTNLLGKIALDIARLNEAKVQFNKTVGRIKKYLGKSQERLNK
jgi:predicted membrane GTPase involved in stress response